MPIRVADGQYNIVNSDTGILVASVNLDGFSRDDDAFTDYLTSLARWRGAGASLVGGKLVITPTLGGELSTDGGVENWASATNLTSWTETLAGTSTVNREATTIHGGTYAARMDLDASNSSVILSQQITAAAGAWLQLSAWGARSTTGTFAFSDNAGVAIGPNQTLTGTYAQYLITERLASANPFRGVKRLGSASNSLYFDDLSFKALTLSTAIVLRRCRLPTFNMTTPLASTLTTGTQMGIIFALDDPNLLDLGTATFGLSYYDGAGNVVIAKCIAGTWSTVATVASAWGATKKLDAKRSDPTTFSIYNSTSDFGTLVSTQTIAGLTGQWYGFFSTYSGNQFDPAANPFKMVPYAA